MKKNNKNIILFDGECNFCSFWVKFVVKRDKKDQFRFTSLQSEIAKSYLEKYNIPSSLDTVVLLKHDGSMFVKSSAALNILKLLGGLRSFLFVFIIVPAFIRDFCYDFVAKNRYKWFGQQTCELPSNPDFKNKFL